MKALIPILFVSLVLASVPAQAGGAAKSLTPEFYKSLAMRGNSKLGYRWMANGYTPAKGITWDGKIEWKAAERNTTFLRALDASLKTVVASSGDYKLSVTVCQVESDFVSWGWCVVEFRVTDAKGDLVAMALERASVRMNRDRIVDYQSGADAIATDLTKDLF